MQQVSKALEEGEHFGAGPVLGADEFAADDAFAIDDVGLGPHIGMEEMGSGFIGIANGGEVDVMLGDEGLECGGVFGLALIGRHSDADDLERRHLMVELHERGQFFKAGRAPRTPEVE